MSEAGASPAATIAYLRNRIPRRPSVLLVLGSGLGSLGDQVQDATRIPFAEIPGFAKPTVVGHGGQLIAGMLEGVECLVLQGRFHGYEGHEPSTLTLPVRTAAALGARTLFVTAAAGGLNPSFEPGDLMILNDHINFMWRNPLLGPVIPGDERFPDMSEPYDGGLQALAERVALERGVRVVRGVYAAVGGPSYETRAEVRMLQRFGGDAVGMSTVPEVLVARAMGMRVLGISLITNPAAGLSLAPLDHSEVVAAGREAEQRFATLVRGVLAALRTEDETQAA